MMKIDAIFGSSELADMLHDGAYDVPEGSTADSLLEAALLEAGTEISEAQRDNLVFLFNGRHISGGSELNGGGVLRVLHKVLGG